MSNSAQTELRRARLLAMLRAAENAGITPIPVLEFHGFVFLANVLSPLWDLVPQKRSVKRRQGGPYFPDVQEDLDRLIGLGAVEITGLAHVKDSDGKWALDGSFSLNFDRAVAIIDALLKFEDEAKLYQHYSELAFAYSELTASERILVVGQDATYSDDRVSEGAIIDYAEWRSANFSTSAARYFDKLMPDYLPATPSQKVHLYLQHMRRRLPHAG